MRCLAFALLVICGVTQAFANGALALQKRVQEVYRDHRDSVVTIYAVHGSGTNGDTPSILIGTGFFISRDGHLLTNANTVIGAERVWFERDSIGYLVEAVGQDTLTNVAVLRAKALPAEFDYLRFSDSSSRPAPGAFVLAISSEFGMPPGPSLGMVTGANTQYGDRVLPTVFLRTDLSAEKGKGGAPVFDLNGAVAGMLIVSLPEIGSSFLLPARAIQRVRDDILFAGKVTFAHFGFDTRQIAGPEQSVHVVVESIEEKGPAAEAGVQSGDILRRVGDFPIQRDADMRQAFFYTRPEETVLITVERDGEELELPVRAGRRESPPTIVPTAAREGPLPVMDRLRGETEEEAGN